MTSLQLPTLMSPAVCFAIDDADVGNEHDPDVVVSRAVDTAIAQLTEACYWDDYSLEAICILLRRAQTEPARLSPIIDAVSAEVEGLVGEFLLQAVWVTQRRQLLDSARCSMLAAA